VHARRRELSPDARQQRRKLSDQVQGLRVAVTSRRWT
jgi:hypothetical protein